MISIKESRRRILLPLIALVTAMTIGSACFKSDKTHHLTDTGSAANNGIVDVDPVLDPKKVEAGNVDATFEMVIGFSNGQRSVEQLKELYDRLNETQRKELAQKSDGDGRRFVTLLVSGVANEKTNQILDHFLRNLDETTATLQIESKASNLNPFDIMRRSGRPAGEKSEDAHKALAILLNRNVKRVNEFTDASNKFDAAKFNGVFTACAAMNPDKTTDVIKELHPGNFDTWLGWAVGNRNFAKVPFVRFYQHGDDTRKFAMRNQMLEAAFASGADELIKFINDTDELGLSKGFATDIYKMRNRADNADFEGPLLFAVSKRVAEEETAAGSKLVTAMDLVKVAEKVKGVLQNDYDDFATVKTFGPDAGETIYAALTAAGISPAVAKVALSLRIASSDLIAEVTRIARLPAPADYVASELLEEMFNNYATDPNTANLDTLASFTVQDSDNPANELVLNDKLIHVMARFKTDDRLLRIFEIFLQGVTDAKAVVADDGAGDSALRLLCDHDRHNALTGDNHDDMIAIVVNNGVAADVTKIDNKQGMAILSNAVIKKGVPADVMKIFVGAHDDVINSLMTYSAKNPDVAKPAFKASYATFDALRKERFRNALLMKTFKQGPAALIAMVTEAAEWGLQDGLGTDSYELTTQGSTNTDKGKFLFVVTQFMGKNLDLDVWKLAHLHEISGKIKEVLKSDYINHVNMELFVDTTGANETIYHALLNLGISEGRAKYALQLDDKALLSVNNVYEEVCALNVHEDTTILQWLYVSAVDTDAKADALTTIKTKGKRFIHALVRLKATAETNVMLVDFLAKLDSFAKGEAALQVAKTTGGFSALEIIANHDRKIDGEDRTQRQAMIAQLVEIGGPIAVDAIRNVGDFNIVLDALSAKSDSSTMISLFQGVHTTLMPNLLIWVENDFVNRAPIFKAAYTNATPELKTKMGNGLLTKALKANVAAVKKLVNDADQWGIREGFATDTYDDDKRSFLHVAADVIGYNIVSGVPGWTLTDLSEISSSMKTILQDRYVSHAEGIVALLKQHGIPEQRAKQCLNLTASLGDVFSEAWYLGRKFPSGSTETLRRLYDATVKTPADANNLLKFNDNGDLFIHLLALLAVTADTNALLNDFVGKLSQNYKDLETLPRIFADQGSAESALQILTNHKRKHPGENLGERQTMITTLVAIGRQPIVSTIDHIDDVTVLLDALLAKGKTEELSTAFNAISPELLFAQTDSGDKGLARWAYDNRGKTISDGDTTKVTIPMLYRTKYDRAKNGLDKIRNAIIQVAWIQDKIGNDADGVVSVIKKGFLSDTALMADYLLFDNKNSQHTLLFGVLYNTAQLSVTGAIKAKNPTLNAWNLAGVAIETVLQGGDQNAVRDALGNSHGEGDAAYTAISGSLTKVQVSTLAQALKAALGEDNWDEMCIDDKNAAKANAMAEVLVHFTIAGNPDQNTVKSPALLDY